MKLLCLDVPKPGASLEKYQPHMVNEARHGWKLYKSGVIREIYFRQDRPGVAILAEADSVEAAKKELGDDHVRSARLAELKAEARSEFASRWCPSAAAWPEPLVR